MTNGKDDPWITFDQWVGFARWALTFALGLAVGKGWLSTQNVESAWNLVLQVAGPLGAAGTAFWTYIANGRRSILKAAVKDPNVASVTVKDPKTSAAIPSDKIVNGA